MFESVLVANRGEIARRVIRTVQRMGLRAIAVYSEADAELPFVAEADEAVLLGPPPPAASYLDVAKVLEAARQSGAEAIHPGYGFLSENAGFAQAVLDAGLVWIGPAPEAIAAMGDKVAARNRVAAAGVPVAPGTAEPLTDVEEALRAAASIGYPLMVKAAGGGGGIGMKVAWDDAGLRSAFATAQSAAQRFFASPAILLERYVPGARHVEVQILGLPDGRVVALGERDCSVQRRHQKVVEETPCPVLPEPVRRRMFMAAVRAGEAVDYRGAGTVEFLLDPASLRDDDPEAGVFYFLEMNTRLQVEHPITEMVTGIDLVEQQILVAAGKPPSFNPDDIRRRGHAIEFRVYAEDPQRFFPNPGTITAWEEPAGEGIRVDAGYRAGNTVTQYYDPLLAKLCVHGVDRAAALDRARRAVAAFRIEGPKNNVPFFAELLENEEFCSGKYDTGLIERMRS
ncbi:MAG: biotin carboxylase [Acidothermus cellulolyticus]|nr:biotin carboxylase [Acidothermus cellulolyticus]